MASSLTKQEKEIYAKLKVKKQDKIREWLDVLKKGTDDQSKVVNLLTDSKIITNKDTGIYPIIIKWCILNIKDYDFKGIPNYEKILSMMDAATSDDEAGAAGAATSANILTILKEWKENPTINPYTGATISISIREGTDYAELYKKTITELIKDVLKSKKSDDKKSGDAESKPEKKTVVACRECAPACLGADWESAGGRGAQELW